MKQLLLIVATINLAACSASGPRVSYTEHRYRVYREPVVSYREYRVDRPPERPVTVRGSVSAGW